MKKNIYYFLIWVTACLILTSCSSDINGEELPNSQASEAVKPHTETLKIKLVNEKGDQFIKKAALNHLTLFLFDEEGLFQGEIKMDLTKTHQNKLVEIKDINTNIETVIAWGYSSKESINFQPMSKGSSSLHQLKVFISQEAATKKATGLYQGQLKLIKGRQATPLEMKMAPRNGHISITGYQLPKAETSYLVKIKNIKTSFDGEGYPCEEKEERTYMVKTDVNKTLNIQEISLVPSNEIELEIFMDNKCILNTNGQYKGLAAEEGKELKITFDCSQPNQLRAELLPWKTIEQNIDL